MTDNITPFPGSAEMPENLLQLAPRHPGWCDHATLMIDGHLRTIACADPKCGAALDPFDYLHKNAQHLQRAWDNYRHASREATAAAERVSVLKKEEQRLRAMVKRLQEKSGAVVSVRGKEKL